MKDVASISAKLVSILIKQTLFKSHTTSKSKCERFQFVEFKCSITNQMMMMIKVKHACWIDIIIAYSLQLYNIVYLNRGKHFKNRIRDLESNRSPNSQTIKAPEERLLLVGDGVGDRLPPYGSEQDDSMQGIKERGQERLELDEGIAGGHIFTADKRVGVD